MTNDITEKLNLLVDTLKKNLSNVRVYRVANISIDIYIIGKIQSGDLVRLS